MTLEQRVELLENKLEETLRLLHYYIHIDNALFKHDAANLVDWINEIKEM